MTRYALAAIFAVTITLLSAAPTFAFCGFYVAGGDAKLFNEATQVVLMRHGNKTALSMQNNYEGPTTEFAMVVPVPQVLQKENVKTLEKEAFDKIDRLTAPRLVEYWEQDPCYVPAPMAEMAAPGGVEYEDGGGGGVKIEAQFKVGEYDIVVLSADESTGLDTWLRQEKYNIPAGAEPYFQPYIEGGMYFFVAKVDPDKVKYEDGRAVLSPLRFDYESEEFQLPIRLGMINSRGKQDLLVYILAQGQRYAVANYPNTFIPTNVEVRNEVRDNFGSFYRALFDQTQEANEGAVVTEYAWDASTCDPCPGPTLDQADYATFGADALGAQGRAWVVTRLHARYTRDEIGEDLTFEAAPGVAGGRQTHDPATGALEQGASPNPTNMFQGRYIIRHEWDGDVDCDDPQYGRWGGPEGAGSPRTGAAPSANTEGRAPAFDAAEPISLEALVKQKIPELKLEPAEAEQSASKERTDGPVSAEGPKSTCAGCTTGPSDGPWGVGLFLLACAAAFRRRRDGPGSRPR